MRRRKKSQIASTQQRRPRTSSGNSRRGLHCARCPDYTAVHSLSPLSALATPPWQGSLAKTQAEVGDLEHHDAAELESLEEKRRWIEGDIQAESTQTREQLRVLQEEVDHHEAERKKAEAAVDATKKRISAMRQKQGDAAGAIHQKLMQATHTTFLIPTSDAAYGLPV